MPVVEAAVVLVTLTVQTLVVKVVKVGKTDQDMMETVEELLVI